jgi:hypothetical protein
MLAVLRDVRLSRSNGDSTGKRSVCILYQERCLSGKTGLKIAKFTTFHIEVHFFTIT